ncbi:HlyD family efflux transporter periplasmic adaptor subunit [Marinobacter orientalis]|uniref:HlyD family efflux transporter periplasmic adaptor subunit n=1 Tax=Marinobacter orientalis TaxID=1928859 RepID=A0A7Y0REY1_9GAMM|nr:HlyD family efflux transporter periplasmic adaptor subunit [Marinobacter orientalis]NMT65001.1 HlyD family efflux transporter periplasmic adaptor subunit [Marinobacter orientalis]TGX48108.1 HlyD family efflux transporter periplasmic adaptor subunit [Marinobacter orientalis]
MVAAQSAVGTYSDHYWPLLIEASSSSDAFEPWLAVICQSLDLVVSGLLLFQDEDQTYAPVAQWPEAQLPSRHLSELAELTIKQQQGSVRKMGQQTLIAYPIKLDQELLGVAALAIDSSDMSLVRAGMRQLQWGSAWLRDIIRKDALSNELGKTEYTRLALDIIGDVIDSKDSKTAEYQLVHRLVNQFSLERVCLGFFQKQTIAISTISHSASFGKQMNLVRSIEELMEEAIEQRTIILHPGPDKDIPMMTQAHASYREAYKTGDLLTIPLMVKSEAVGALFCECGRGKNLGDQDIELINGVAAFVGSLLIEKRMNDRHILLKCKDSLMLQYEKMAGKGYTGRKLFAAASILLIALLTLVKGTYYVAADGVVEGEIQRAVVAPFDGFILASHFRAGDYVEEGQVMATLDDRDLALERLRRVSQKQEYQFEYDRALSSRNRADANVIEARIEQADIQLELLDKQLTRTRLIAPFNGLVVSGDLSQSIGSSIRRGDTLFEVAPLDAYRLTLLVDETQIMDVDVGQSGTFLSASLPDMPFEFSLNKVTPVAIAEEGKTVFEVEAKILDPGGVLRPGMSGLGKIDAGDEPLLWIWTRSFSHWVRLTFWSLAG